MIVSHATCSFDRICSYLVPSAHSFLSCIVYCSLSLPLQIIALVVARTHEEALAAARLVHVEYEDLPAIISIDDAVAAQSFFPNVLEISTGSVEEKRKDADVIVSGRMNVGGQEVSVASTSICI